LSASRLVDSTWMSLRCVAEDSPRWSHFDSKSTWLTSYVCTEDLTTTGAKLNWPLRHCCNRLFNNLLLNACASSCVQKLFLFIESLLLCLVISLPHSMLGGAVCSS